MYEKGFVRRESSGGGCPEGANPMLCKGEVEIFCVFDRYSLYWGVISLRAVVIRFIFFLGAGQVQYL